MAYVNSVIEHARSRLLFLAILLAGLSQANAQHNLLLYNMDQVPQSNLLNPGRLPSVNSFVGLPVLSGVRLGAGNTGFSYRQFDMVEMNDSYDFDYAGLRDELRSGNNRLVSDTDIRFLSLGLRLGKGYFSFDVGDASFASGNYTQDMLSMFDDIQKNRLGPEASKDTLYDQSGHNLTGAYYRSYSVGYAYQFCSDLSVGGRVRYLQGVAGVWGQNDGLMFRYPGSGNYFEVQGQLMLHAAGVNIDEDASALSVLFPGGNNGFAFDFGGVYRVNDRIEVSFSAVNLGRIKWKSNVNYEMVGSHLNFSAVDIEEHMDLWGEVAEDLTEGEPMTGGLYFMTPLPKRFYLGGNYQVNPRTSVGLLINPVRYDGVTDMAFAVSGNTELGEVLGLSAALGYNRYTPFNLGLGVTADLGVVQFYAITDNLVNTFSWKNSRSVQAQFGINLNFGGPDQSETVPGFEPLAEMSDTSGVFPAAEDAGNSGFFSFKRRRDAPEQTDPVPAVPAATPAVAGGINSSGVFTWTGTARDLETGEPLPGVQVELYKIADSGEKELSLIRSFLDGRLSVSLDLGSAYHIVVDKPGYEPTEIFIQKSKLLNGELASTRDVLLHKPASIPSEIRTAPEVPAQEPAAAAARPVSPEMFGQKPLDQEPATSSYEEDPQPVEEQETAPTAELYRLTNATSLRAGPTHTTGVILRFNAGDTVEVLEKTSQWWWKVRFGEQTGYVKAQLLER